MEDKFYPLDGNYIPFKGIMIEREKQRLLSEDPSFPIDEIQFEPTDNLQKIRFRFSTQIALDRFMKTEYAKAWGL